jgi:hypothetical protein
MSELGEAVGLAFFTNPQTCPFCSSKPEKGKKLELTNDAADLGVACGGMPSVVMKNPPAVSKSEDYYIWEDYFITADQSRICLSAHHIIPGNAALSRVPSLLKWLAGTVEFVKVWYEKTPEVKRKKKAGRYKPGTVEKSEEDPDGPDQTISFILKPTKSGATTSITREIVTDEDLVTGVVKYDVNGKLNGEWLATNKPVWQWTKVAGMAVKNIDGKRTTLEKGYAFNAMRATTRQFHDAHERYSKAARRALGNLAKKVEKRAEDCASNNGCPGSAGKTGKHKAPSDLKDALDNLSDKKIRPKLKVPTKGTKSPKPKKPWYTSPHSLQF